MRVTRVTKRHLQERIMKINELIEERIKLIGKKSEPDDELCKLVDLRDDLKNQILRKNKKRA